MDELRQFFDKHKLFGVPTVDNQDRLVGVVLPEAVGEASLEEADRQYLGFSGIIGGEEFRTMPLSLAGVGAQDVAAALLRIADDHLRGDVGSVARKHPTAHRKPFRGLRAEARPPC